LVAGVARFFCQIDGCGSDAATIYDSPTANRAADKFLLLRTSANVTADLLVF